MMAMMQKMMNITTAITPPITAESLLTALVRGSLSSVFPKGSDEEYVVVAVFTSASIMDAQLDSVKEPLTVTGAMVGWRKAALRGAMWLY